MEKRTPEEIQAYVDGYNQAAKDLHHCIKGRKNLADMLVKFNAYVEAINSVVNKEEHHELKK